MATDSQVDMIRRICRTHEIDEERVQDVTGSFERLGDDQSKALICSLADGEFGGISSPPRADQKITDWQHWTLYRLLPSSETPRDDLLKAARDLYPDVEWLSDLTCRQAARLIVELDRRRPKEVSDVATA